MLRAMSLYQGVASVPSRKSGDKFSGARRPAGKARRPRISGITAVQVSSRIRRCDRACPNGRRTTTSATERRPCMPRCACWMGWSSANAAAGTGVRSSCGSCGASTAPRRSGSRCISSWTILASIRARRCGAGWHATCARIRRGTFTSVPALERAIKEYLAHYNQHQNPFIWTKDADTILAKIDRCKEALNAPA